jgi:hypothetical protein
VGVWVGGGGSTRAIQVQLRCIYDVVNTTPQLLNYYYC